MGGHRLKKLDQIDEARKAREAAKNKLEAFIYATRNKLYNDAEDVAVRGSTSDEGQGPQTRRAFVAVPCHTAAFIPGFFFC